MKQINKVQELNLKLIASVYFNNLNGKFVAEQLRKNRDLWDAVIMDSEYSEFAKKKGDFICGCDLGKLASLSKNRWNVDNLFILSNGKNDKQLAVIAGMLGANTIEWIEGEAAGDLLGSWPNKKKILKVWWD